MIGMTALRVLSCLWSLPPRARGRLRHAILVGAASLAPAALRAQSSGSPPVRLGRIHGVVFDSSAKRPLVGATVQLVRLDNPAIVRDASTNTQGEYTIDSLPAAQYAVGARHPRLDSLGVQQLARGVELRDGKSERVRLSVPSARSMIRSVCGDTAVRERSGYVRGRLRDAEQGRRPVRGTVRVQWLELALTSAGTERTVPTLEVDTDADGIFTLCGVPLDGVLRVRGWSGADSSGAAELTVPEDGLLLRDLYVGRVRHASIAAPLDTASPDVGSRDSTKRVAADTSKDSAIDVLRGDGQLRGKAMQAQGPPLDNVRLSVWGTGLESASTASGVFVLSDLPTGTHTLDARAIGYLPQTRVVDVIRDDSTTLVVSFERLTRMDTLRIRAAVNGVRSRSLAEFDARRKSAASGTFLGPEDLLERPPLRTTDIFGNMAGVRVIPSGSGYRVRMRGTGRELCQPSLFIDGAPVVDTDDLEFVMAADFVRAVEVYPSAMTAPAQFTGRSTCGVIVFWTGERK